MSNVASGIGAAVFGLNNNAGGLNAFSIGTFNSASGQYSFSAGGNSRSQGVGSFTSGWFASASGDYQTVVGTNNETSNTSPYAFIVGGGIGSASSSRKTLVFASGSQFQLSGSFAPQYRNITNVQTSSLTSPGVAVNNRDYNITFAASNIFTGKNAISLPSNVPVGTVIYLQRTSGTSPLNSTSAVQISGSSGYLINGAAGYTFPLALYARRMFVFSGAATGWYTEPNPIV